MLTGSTVQEIEDCILENMKKSDDLLSTLETTKDDCAKQTYCEFLNRLSEQDPINIYIAVTGEEGNYEAKFNSGLLKIEQLALEAYKKELEKKK